MTEFNRDEIIAINLQGKEWFDKVNGNSYWSARATLTDSNHNTHTLPIEYQYGYGSFYIQRATEILRELRYLDEQGEGYRSGYWSSGRRVVWSESIQTGCKKRDMVAWGKD